MIDGYREVAIAAPFGNIAYGFSGAAVSGRGLGAATGPSSYDSAPSSVPDTDPIDVFVLHWALPITAPSTFSSPFVEAVPLITVNECPESIVHRPFEKNTIGLVQITGRRIGGSLFPSATEQKQR